jgi:predicted MPP superfamily phosphohydrolase
VGGASLVSVPLYARFIEPWWMEVTRTAIPLNRLPHAFEDFTIAQLSDLHYCGDMPLEQMDDAVRRVMEGKPDLIALTGDFLFGFDENRIHPLAEVLSQLKAPHGVVAVPGNHDYWIFSLKRLPTFTGKEKVVFQALERAGIHVMRNESRTIRKQGARLHLVGIDDYWSGMSCSRTAFGDLPEDGPRVVLAHNPDTLLDIKDTPFDLMLCGHTHGGQVNIPLAGPFLVPIQLTDYVSGLYAMNRRVIYINRGFGFVWYPLRLRARPEIAFLKLGRPSPAA